MSFQISLCHHLKIIVNQNEVGGGGREFLKVPDCQKIKSYENILGKLQNTCNKMRKKIKNQLSVQSRGETFNSVKKTERD